MVDIDNTKKYGKNVEKIYSNNEEHITVEKAISYCEKICLVPTFIYYTFSHTEQQHKMRLVYVLEQPVTDIEKAKGIYEFLKKALKPLNIDVAPTQLETLFFGGQNIAYISNKFYKCIVKEIETKEFNYEVDYGEYQNFVGKLNEDMYSIEDGCLSRVDDDREEKLANFVPIIEEQVNFDNGKDIEIYYNVYAYLLDRGKVLPTIQVSKEDLENMKFILNDKWGIHAILTAGFGHKDILREAMQILNRDTMKNVNVLAHTGFREIDGKLNYLYHGGIIGETDNLTVDLSRDKLQQYSFTDKEFNIKEALQTSYSILDVAEKEITIPLLAVTYLAPLTSTFAEEGILADFVLWLEGKTGSRKSSLAAVLLSHFGKFNRDNFPCNFKDTANSLEKKSFILKDTLNVIDDYNPEIMGRNKLAVAEKLFGMYGDRCGRDRMCQDGKSLRSPYVARGTCIVTGETFPEVAESRIARAFIVDIKKNSIDLKKLAFLQDNTDKLAYCMKKYIEWIIKNIDNIRIVAKKVMRELQEKITDDRLHGRSVEAINTMYIGFSMFLSFLQDNEIITEEKKKEMLDTCYRVLKENICRNLVNMEDNNPATMFVTAIEQLQVTQRICIEDYNASFGSYTNNLVGYVDMRKGLYYFMPDIIYKEVVKFYSEQKIAFPFSKSSLWKILEDEGYLYRTKGNDRRTVRRINPITHKDMVFVAIYEDKLNCLVPKTAPTTSSAINKLKENGILQEEL